MKLRQLASIVVVSTLMSASFAAMALPTIDQVRAEVDQGHYAQADSMMKEVVAAKPDSAKAHYVYAEVLAHEGKFAPAADEARRAQEIDPAIHFTDPAKFHDFERLLQQEQRGSSRAGAGLRTVASPVMPAPQRSGLPGWVWGLGGALIAVALWRAFSRRSATYPGTTFGAAGPGMSPMPMGPVGPMSPTGTGSGMLGTGLAAAGGFAAGMLAERLLDGHHGGTVYDNSSSSLTSGLVPGMFDDGGSSADAARELEDRPIDFGSGDDWGGSSGGSDDGGGW